MVGLLVLGQAELSRTDVGIVKDSETKLEWQDSYEEGKFIKYSWGGAINYCETLELGGKDDWRLPNINELKSIVMETQYAPSIDEKFESTKNNAYWSSTKRIAGSYYIWGISFDTGVSSFLAYQYFNWDKTNFVRCVRDAD